MARIGIIFGLFLCGLTCAGLLGTTLKSPIQFIPMMLGIPSLFCGVVALNPHRRKNAMFGVAALAMAGIGIGGTRSVMLLLPGMHNEPVASYVLALNLGLFVISSVFLAIYAGFQWQDRRKRDMQRRDSIPITSSAATQESRSREIA